MAKDWVVWNWAAKYGPTGARTGTAYKLAARFSSEAEALAFCDKQTDAGDMDHGFVIERDAKPTRAGELIEIKWRGRFGWQYFRGTLAECADFQRANPEYDYQ